MGYTVLDLEQAQRHVVHGESAVQFQQAIVDAGGLDTAGQEAAEAWLAVYKAGLAKHISARDRIAIALTTRFP